LFYLNKVEIDAYLQWQNFARYGKTLARIGFQGTFLLTARKKYTEKISFSGHVKLKEI